ncbi:hypothetical protein ACIRF8_32305 [Streptomyces sp. NPDC102406]|uniref:hypothetical protein n=1 Tax=Streptomyces sp. NPDC102406 TaxID=3366171 RepID=UPI0037F77EF8
MRTDLNGHGPSPTPAPPEQKILQGERPALAVRMWVLTAQRRRDLVTRYGFDAEAIDLLHHPEENSRVVQQLIRARRLPDASRPAPTHSRGTPAFGSSPPS